MNAEPCCCTGGFNPIGSPRSGASELRQLGMSFIVGRLGRGRCDGGRVHDADAVSTDPRPPYIRDGAGNVTEGSVRHADNRLLPDLGDTTSPSSESTTRPACRSTSGRSSSSRHLPSGSHTASSDSTRPSAVVLAPSWTATRERSRWPRWTLTPRFTSSSRTARSSSSRQTRTTKHGECTGRAHSCSSACPAALRSPSGPDAQRRTTDSGGPEEAADARTTSRNPSIHAGSRRTSPLVTSTQGCPGLFDHAVLPTNAATIRPSSSLFCSWMKWPAPVTVVWSCDRAPGMRSWKNVSQPLVAGSPSE